ncbi:MAG: metal-dependent transcriptional regulator [Deltaproteobacteria bacterium]|nr:metal-dependent transcriptional regulator [Deltaproteobacteria bacterium]
MENKERLSASQEDYLEAIFHIISEKQAVRAKDIALRLKVKNASVTGALRILAGKGLVNYAPYDVISLTTDGKRIAEDIVRRHEVLHDFFSGVLGVSEDDAEKTACEMEHFIPGLILDRLVRFLEFLRVCPRTGSDWIESFSGYCNSDKADKNCVLCTSRRLDHLKGKEKKEKIEGKAIVSLQDLEPGQKGKILKIKGKGESRIQILEKGFSTGSLLEAETRNSDGKRVEVKLKGYHRSLRKDDADKVLVEIIEN